METWTRSNCFCFVESKYLCCKTLDAKSFGYEWCNVVKKHTTSFNYRRPTCKHLEVCAVFAIVTRQFCVSFSYCTFLKLCASTNTLLCWLYFEGDQTTDMPTVIQRTTFKHDRLFVSWFAHRGDRMAFCDQPGGMDGFLESLVHKMVQKELQSCSWCCKSNTK